MGNSRSDEAIRMAVEGRWEDAVTINQDIIEVSPNDIDAHNRLGKALAELGRNGEARKAYELVLELDPKNSIAERNLIRLQYLKDEERSSKEARGIDCRFFIQDTSKARMVGLYKPAPKETIAKMSAGDEVHLEVKGHKLVVFNGSDEYLGEVEHKIGSRLIGLMNTGNEYRAAVSSSRDNRIKIIIRETFQHPRHIGQPSFPPGVIEDINPYVKGSLVKHDIEDEFIEELEEIGDWDDEVEELEEETLPDEDLPQLEKEDAGKVV